MKRIVYALVVLAVSVALYGSIRTAYGDTVTTTLDWLSSTPALDKISTLQPGQLPPYSINGNRDCVNRTFTSALIAGQYKKLDECSIDTAYGSISTSGLLQRQSTDYAGTVRMLSQDGQAISPIAVPNSNTMLYLGSPANNGNYIFFVDDAARQLSSVDMSAFGLVHVLKQRGTLLADKAGNNLPLYYDSMAFSRNGEWLIADAPFHAMVRVNMTTKEVLPFGAEFNLSLGINPGIQTAITSDGRYAAVASRSFTRFDVFDLSSCGATPQSIGGPLPSCKKVDLYQQVSSAIPNLTSLSTVRFVGDTVLTFYASHTDTLGHQITEQYMLYLGEKPGSTTQYLGLGDSFSSGEGAYDYIALTDTPQNKCHISQKSYPYILSEAMSYNRYDSVACSGAKIEDISNSVLSYAGQTGDKIPLEARDLQPILASYTPGLIPQFLFISKYNPQVVTLTAGGNDIDFSGKIARCVSAVDTCYTSYEDRYEIAKQINDQFPRLVDLYTSLKKNTLPSTRFYVAGYPSIFADGNCAANVHFNSDEIAFADALLAHLNETIHRAADKAGVYYVDVTDALTGHRLCETDSAAVAVNGLTVGGDKFGVLGNESFHPNALGHKLLAAAINAKTAGLTAGMPNPDPTKQAIVLNETVPILHAPVYGRNLYNLAFKPMVKTYVFKLLAPVEIALQPDSFKPATIAKIVINSNPTTIYEGTTDNSGGLNVSPQIPQTIEPGIHTIHIYGQNSIGLPIDYSTTIYIEGSDDPGACRPVEASGIDADKDLIDDSCDAAIGAQYPVSTDTPVPTVSADLSSDDIASWHNSVVTVNWLVSDESATTPPQTTAGTEGTQTYSSEPSCNQAGSCTTGAVTLKIDLSSPVIDYHLDQTPSPSGAFNKPVTVTFTCSDSVSGVAACSQPVTVSENGSSVITGTATDNAGNTHETTVFIFVDAAAPHINYWSSPELHNGWNNSAVDVHFSCDDTLSGIDTCTNLIRLEQEGGSQSVTGKATDKAGNVSEFTPRPFNIDLTKPTISYQVSAPPSKSGWYAQPVTVTFTCGDTLSGVNSCSSPVTLSEDGIYPVVGRAEDVAGNIQETVVFIKIDGTPPTLTYTSDASGETWNNHPVSFTFKCQDSVSTVYECTESTWLQYDDKDQYATAFDTDWAGNRTDLKLGPYNIDQTAPTILNVSLDQTTIPVSGVAKLTGTAVDNLSGIQKVEYFVDDQDPGLGLGTSITQAGDVFSANIGTGLPSGIHSITTRAQDWAGNWSEPYTLHITVTDITVTSISGSGSFIPDRQSSILPFYLEALFSPKDRAEHLPISFSFYVEGKDTKPKGRLKLTYHPGTGCHSAKERNTCNYFELDSHSITELSVNTTKDTVNFSGSATLDINNSKQEVNFTIIAVASKGKTKTADSFTVSIYDKDQRLVYKTQSTTIRSGQIKIRLVNDRS